MNASHLLGPGILVGDHGPDPLIVPDGGVLFQGETILEIGRFEDLLQLHPAAEVIDAHEGVILPGLVNAHHHFYSALARGLDPGREMRDFPAILDGLWWRLDRALGPDEIRVSAALSVAECIRHGCTTVIDHHASPSFIDGSLDLIAEEVLAGGISAVCCYEISDRNSHAEALEGLEENLRFAAEVVDHPRLRGLLGLHASFTVSDEVLQLASRRRPERLGIHIHLAEDPADRTLSLRNYGASPLDRLARFGLLDEHALLVHGIHMEDDEYVQIAEAGAALVHNPESNANNAVGFLDIEKASEAGCRLLLGTDGMSSSMLLSLRAAFLMQRAARRKPTLGFSIIPGLLAENVRFAAGLFDLSLLGRIEAGAPADLIVIDAPPPTPIDRSNIFGHLVYGFSLAPCRHTIARGRILYRDFEFTDIDFEQLHGRARILAAGLWKRFSDL